MRDLNIYVDGTLVTVTAVGAEGYVLDHWEGPVTGSGSTVTVTMDDDRTITAFFVPSDVRYVVTVSVSSPDSGTIVLSPAPPADGYVVNTRLTVLARAASGYGFSRWQGDLLGSDPRASIVVDGNKSVGAVFNPGIVADCDPPSGGTVMMDPPQGSAGYSPGVEVTLTATAAEGYRFDRWSGDVASTTRSTVLTMDSAKIVTAHFVKEGSFPWWWIGVGVALVLAALFVVFGLRRLGGAATEE